MRLKSIHIPSQIIEQPVKKVNLKRRNKLIYLYAQKDFIRNVNMIEF